MLTDTAIKNAKAKEKDYSLADGRGLRLLVRSNGSKLWQFRYRLSNKASIFSLGGYPEVTVAQARKARDDAHSLVSQGINPAHARQTAKLVKVSEQADTFKAVAEEWIDSKKSKWAPYTLRQVTRFFASDTYPDIGHLPIRQVTPAHILAIIKRAEKRGAESVAINLRMWCSSVFRYAIAHLRAENDPAAHLRGTIEKPKTEHAKPLSREQIALFATKLNEKGGYQTTRIALKLMLYTFVRTVELRQARWTEINLDAGEWRIPAERMKKREPHLVPLPTQAIQLLRELHTLTGSREYLFPNYRTPNSCMTATTLNRALERMGFTAIGFSGHGFRATASTMLNEIGFRPDVIERQLAHAERNKVRASYNQGEYLSERRKMMNQWADLCDQMMKGDAKVIGIGIYSKISA